MARRQRAAAEGGFSEQQNEKGADAQRPQLRSLGLVENKIKTEEATATAASNQQNNSK